MLNANFLLIILPLGLVGILQKRTTLKAGGVSVQNANLSDPGIFRIRVLTLYVNKWRCPTSGLNSGEMQWRADATFVSARISAVLL
jgi:hypothetical protein